MILLKSQKEALLAPLQSVSGIVERRHTLPILSNVLLEKKGDKLTLLATDIEIQITTASKVGNSGEDAAVTVGAKKLQDILRSLPDNSEVSLVLEDKRLQVRAGKSRFSLQTLPADDFPRMAQTHGSVTKLKLSQKDFKQLLAKTQYAMATQDVRYYLNGLLLLAEGNELRAVATDGHRLAYSSMDIEGDLTRREMILPRKTVLELNRLLSDTDETLDMSFTENQVIFSFGSVVLVTKVIDGKFPDYERVIPASLSTHMTVDRQVLASSLSRAAILTNDKFRGVRVVLENNSLRIMAANAEQEEATEEVEVEYAGNTLDVGFNISYLQDVLSNLNTDTVRWSFNDANSSSLISVPGNDRFKYVVMPMRI